eukprot:TRINITY_DN94385_c0_g1_i1.p1 TRINITY_DN94385_c0_g1~~TRINITY_DN94385_c0_g1_i1.p1  ORF type:complete len:316 (-),score=126.91 TRINITY_DN94385_c0_g1_i1:109-1056(-)
MARPQLLVLSLLLCRAAFAVKVKNFQPDDEETAAAPAGADAVEGLSAFSVSENDLISSEANEALAKEEVEEAVRIASKEGVLEVEETARESEMKWENTIKNVQKQALTGVQETRDGELGELKKKVQAESLAQAKVIDKMSKSIKDAQKEAVAEISKSAATWARSTAENQAYKVTSESMADVAKDEAAVQKLRDQAVAYNQAAADATEKLMKIAKQSKELSEELEHSHPEELAKKLNSTATTSLEEAKKAKKLAEESDHAAKEARSMAERSKKSAKEAKEKAAALKKLVEENAQQIAELEKRAKVAADKASASAAR